MTVTLADIQAAARRIEGVAVKTPLLSSLELDRRTGGQVFIKPENLQHIGAFKFRGAYNRLSQLNDVQRQVGVVAFSSGNHAQGVALAARMLGMPATIVMPEDAPSIKIAGTRSLGAQIRLYNRRQESREQIAGQIAADSGQIIVPAFDDPDIIAGQGTCGLELIAQMQERGGPPDLVICPVGGGGLIAGLSTVVKELVPAAQVCGVEPESFDDHARSLSSGQRQQNTGSATSICDSLMAPMPGELTWSINSRSVDRFVTVSDRQVEQAIAFAFRYLKLVVEPGGAVALAALLQGGLTTPGRRIGLVLSGGNVDPELFCRCLDRNPEP
ncbi:MAG: threonine/serine dehydratase [Gammaproteobacteria bacterium]|nr:threonine/serine dehydratase [Pseudomonadales bacterium]MCP5346633.1 threonine/serine dehydratase [Pseudomonadales bacterium]